MYVSLDDLIDTSNMKMTDDQIIKGLIKLGFVRDITLQSTDSMPITVNVSKKEQSLTQSENQLAIYSDVSAISTTAEITVNLPKQKMNLSLSENKVSVTKDKQASLAA